MQIKQSSIIGKEKAQLGLDESDSFKWKPTTVN